MNTVQWPAIGSELLVKLALHISQLSCECGNRWTHSIVTHINGGTPTNAQTFRENLEEIWVGPERKTKICFACAPGHIKPNIWQPSPPRAFGPSTTQRVSAEDLLR